jgi:outer membrane immunogenic protein
MAGGLATPALAAGPGPVAVEPILSAPVMIPYWQGAYGGLTLGAAIGSSDAELGDYFGDIIQGDVENLGLFPDEIEEDETNVIGGLTLGYNYQRESFVGGVEFDISALNQDILNDFSRLDTMIIPGVTTDTSYRTEINSLATLRLRGGFARDRDMFFATAGLAAGQVKNEFTLGLPGFPLLDPTYSNSWENEDTLYGFVVGAGYERRITDRLSLKGEVLYYDLEDVTIEALDSATFPGQGIDYEFQNDGYVARVGINLSF